MRNPLIYLWVWVFTPFLSGIAQSRFEGTIDFKMHNKRELLHYNYFVKGDKVKIDLVNARTNQLENTFIVDLATGYMITIRHIDKLWIENKASVQTMPPGKTEVIKTDSTRSIQGYNCTEYIVKNKVDGVNLSYWIVADKFDFYTRLLQIMNQRDRFALYFLQLPDIKGKFPFQAVISRITKMEKEFWEVTNIEEKGIEAGIFNIPSGYKKIGN